MLQGLETLSLRAERSCENTLAVAEFLEKHPSVKSGLNFWCVADNLRKGAATNAVQIAEKLIEKGFLPKA